MFSIIEQRVKKAIIVTFRYRVQHESLLQVEKDQSEFIEDFGIK